MKSSEPDPAEAEITVLLQGLGSGDPAATEALFDAVYGRLHWLAAQIVGSKPATPSLQATQLVHDFYLKLRAWEAKQGSEARIPDRKRFLRFARTAMKHLLIQRTRHRRVRQRDLDARQQQVGAGVVAADPLDHLDVANALERLAAFDPRAAEVVELRFFRDLSNEEIAEELGVSSRTVRRTWNAARLRLRRLLAEGAGRS